MGKKSSKRAGKRSRVLTLNLPGHTETKTLTLDLASDADLSLLVELLFGALVDISDHLERIRWNTGPLGDALNRGAEVSPTEGI